MKGPGFEPWPISELILSYTYNNLIMYITFIMETSKIIKIHLRCSSKRVLTIQGASFYTIRFNISDPINFINKFVKRKLLNFEGEIQYLLQLFHRGHCCRDMEYCNNCFKRKSIFSI